MFFFFPFRRASFKLAVLLQSCGFYLSAAYHSLESKIIIGRRGEERRRWVGQKTIEQQFILRWEPHPYDHPANRRHPSSAAKIPPTTTSSLLSIKSLRQCLHRHRGRRCSGPPLHIHEMRMVHIPPHDLRRRHPHLPLHDAPRPHPQKNRVFFFFFNLHHHHLLR